MGIFEKGWEKPSPIQEESIPIALSGWLPTYYMSPFLSKKLYLNCLGIKELAWSLETQRG